MNLKSLRKNIARLKKEDSKVKPASSAASTTTSYGYGNFCSSYEKCEHPALVPIKVGGYDLWLGARRDIKPETTVTFDLIFPLNGELPASYYGKPVPIICSTLADRGGVPECWPEFIAWVVEQIKKGKKCLAYCTGGHGRTGTFGASVIAVMEPHTEDPIAALRQRHCDEGVESLKQAIAIFALQGKEVPAKYTEEFTPKAYTQHTADPTCDFVKYKTAKHCYNFSCPTHKNMCDMEQEPEKTTCYNRNCVKHFPVTNTVSTSQETMDLLILACKDGLISSWGQSNGLYWVKSASNYTRGAMTPSDVKSHLGDLKSKNTL